MTGSGFSGATEYFTTTFQASGGSAQATVGDSGGGVFVVRNGEVELAGIMGLVTSSGTGQAPATSVFGNQTYNVDLVRYRSQILDVVNTTPVPELSPFWLLGVIGAMWAGWRFRTKRAALR